MVDEILQLVELEMTCSACPSQWEGRLVDGRYVYVRCRWGVLQVGIEYTLDEAIENRRKVWEKFNNGFHGVMDTNTMLSLTGMSWRGLNA